MFCCFGEKASEAEIIIWQVIYTMQIAICDDDPLFLELLASQVEALKFSYKIDCFSKLKDFLHSFESGKRYDAVLMDIDWKQVETGIDIAEKLATCYPQTKIIYVTGYNNRFSQHIFLRKANLSGYLVKPVDSELLQANLEKVANALKKPDDSFLTVNIGGKPISIPHSDLVYLESTGHIVNIHTRDELLKVYEKLDKLTAMLPEGFLRCHKSYLVSMRSIRRFREHDVLLDTGDAIPVSRSRYAQAKADYFRYMGKSF